jgi:hypothetical protein
MLAPKSSKYDARAKNHTIPIWDSAHGCALPSAHHGRSDVALPKSSSSIAFGSLWLVDGKATTESQLYGGAFRKRLRASLPIAIEGFLRILLGLDVRVSYKK